MADKLTPQQEMAVKNRGGRLLVSAAAGSGKTKVLVDRLLSYIMDPACPANVDDFLIITYTKAAAAELRGKISAKLTDLIACEPRNHHLQQQIQRLYLAKISTVHSFCSDILREYAYRLDLPADFRVADENECLEIQIEVLDKLMDSAYETLCTNPDFQILLNTQGFGRDDRKIPEIILKVYKSARCHLDPEKWLDWCVSSMNNEQIDDAGETIWGNYLINDLHHYLDLQIDAMERCAILAERNGTMPKAADLLYQNTDQIKELRKCSTWDEIAEYPPIEYGTMRFPKNAEDMEMQERIKAVRNACKEGIKAKLRSFSEKSEQIFLELHTLSSATRCLVQMVRTFSAQYEKAKQSRRILDFGDLEHRTLDLFLGKKRTGITSAAKEVGARFREIMVDEYQDSNGVQDAIFNVLTQERHNCFMVGDVKQSIYQFRLADPGIFIEKYNSFLPAAEAEAGFGRKVMLSQNFRSSGGVIQAVNDVFGECMSPEVGGLRYGRDEMLYEGIPHEPLKEPEVELYGIQVQHDTYEEESEFVADRIITLLDGNHMVRGKDGIRPIQPEDIVILLRSPGSVGGEFRYALEKKGISCTTGDSTDLLQAPEISTLCSLLLVIENPLQDIPLLAVLASPLFGFTADDLAAFRGKDKKDIIYYALCEDHSDKTAYFMSCLNDLRKKSKLYTISELIDCIFKSTGMEDIYASMVDGEVRTANLRAFFQLASDYEETGKKDLCHFLQYLDSVGEQGVSVSCEQAGAGAVTIMSIHKSKGLEFPVVFLCGLSRSFNRESVKEQVLCHKELGLGLYCADEKLRIRYPSIAKRAIASRIIEESISEEMRVLYVAMTRARDRLIMTYASRNLESDLTGISFRMDICSRELVTAQVHCPGTWVLLTALKHTEAGDFFSLGGKPMETSLKEPIWHIETVEMGQTDTISGAYAEARPKTVFNPADCIGDTLDYCYPYQAATVTPSKQTATQLKGRQKDIEAAENSSINWENKFRKPSFHEKTRSGVNYGTAIHSIMQYISFDKCGNVHDIEQEVARLQNELLISPEMAQIADCNGIAAFFATDLGKKLMCGSDVIREFKFSILSDASQYYPDVHEDQVLLQGVVDCALIEDDGITVIDFKTDRVTEKTIQNRAESYRLQLLTYAQALSRIFERPIKRACLYFFHKREFVDMLLN